MDNDYQQIYVNKKAGLVVTTTIDPNPVNPFDELSSGDYKMFYITRSNSKLTNSNSKHIVELPVSASTTSHDAIVHKVADLIVEKVDKTVELINSNDSFKKINELAKYRGSKQGMFWAKHHSLQIIPFKAKYNANNPEIINYYFAEFKDADSLLVYDTYCDLKSDIHDSKITDDALDLATDRIRRVNAYLNHHIYCVQIWNYAENDIAIPTKIFNNIYPCINSKLNCGEILGLVNLTIPSDAPELAKLALDQNNWTKGKFKSKPIFNVE